MAKLTGRERYIDDEPIDGIFWGMTVRSPVPRGRIREVRFKKGIDWSKFVIVDHRDVPGRNEVFLIERDQPVLAGTITRHVHEAVLLLAHEDRDLLRRAVRSVEVIVDPEPPVLDFRAPPAPQHVQHGSDNVLKRLLIEKGEVDAALARSPIVVEGEYETGAQEHIYIENQGAQAWVDRGVVVVKGSMQCPYYVLNALKHALARDESRVRVIQSPTGGGFGGKEDYPSIIALHAALLALKAGGRPVRIIYDRSEDMAATTKRHPALIRHRTGVDRDGRLLGQSIDVILDGGAYVTLSPVVLSRGMIHAAGPYFCENVRVTGRAVLTNSVPTGAFRGFGAPQTIFACERHMDVIAARLGLPPEQVRRVNLLRDGQTTATGQTITDGVDRVALMDAALRESRYHERVREFAAFNAGGGPLRRGIGLATFWHGAGFTGGGEVKLASRVRVAGLADGRAEVRSANTEMGQGTTTIFTQIAAARLGFDPADVLVAIPDTARVPNSGPTVASRTAMVVGRLIERACDDVRLKVGLSAHEHGPAVRDAILRWHRAHPGAEPIGEAVYDPPPGIHWDDSTYRGDAYSVFAWATYVAEVEVDVRTFATRVTGFTAVQEIGRVINETLARGQVQGGVVQGVGWAIMEKCTWKNGAMANNSLTNYIIPTSGDVPPIGVRFIEGLNPHGGMGSKGLGELPIDGPAPAILNAVASATGARAAVIPLTPERLMEEVGATWT
jgi:CO/xanthine dehydrogenase Mo-binding subunit